MPAKFRDLPEIFDPRTANQTAITADLSGLLILVTSFQAHSTNSQVSMPHDPTENCVESQPAYEPPYVPQ